MVEHVVGALGIWAAKEVVSHFVEADDWVWQTAGMALGVGWEFLVGGIPWYGVGVGGGAALVGLVADCLLLMGDRARVNVLREPRSA
jgi:hypothetical protein